MNVGTNTIYNYLGRPFPLGEVPYPLSNGGTDYIRGYEASRKACLESLREFGNLSMVQPVVIGREAPHSVSAIGCYNAGFNDCLRQACKHFEKEQVIK